MDKVIRDGKVAVLVSLGCSAGWSTLVSEVSDEYRDTYLFHPKLIQMVEEGRHREITEEWMEKELGIKDATVIGRDGLYIKWVPVGTKFIIHVYDGHESLETNWITA